MSFFSFLSTGSADKPSSNANKDREEVIKSLADKSVSMPQNMEKDLDLMKQMLSGLSNNNTELIIAAIDKYNEIYAKDDDKKRVVVSGNILNTIKNFHDKLILSMTDNKKNISGIVNREERAKEIAGIKELQTAQSTYEEIKKYVNKDVNAIKDTIVKDDVVAYNPAIKATVENIFDKFSEIKARDTFFQYKYIQMYLFLAIFVQHVYHSMDKFIKDVISINALKDRYRQEAYRQIFGKILDLYGSNGDIPDLEDIGSIDKFFQGLSVDMEKKQAEVKKAYEAAQQNSMEGILKFIIENETGMTDTLMKVVKQKEAESKGQSQSGQQSSPTQPMFGGFVKGGSTFPQAFYDL